MRLLYDEKAHDDAEVEWWDLCKMYVATTCSYVGGGCRFWATSLFSSSNVEQQWRKTHFGGKANRRLCRKRTKTVHYPDWENIALLEFNRICFGSVSTLYKWEWKDLKTWFAICKANNDKNDIVLQIYSLLP